MKIRKYIRHPTDIPLVYHIENRLKTQQSSVLNNACEGGISFRSQFSLEVGTMIQIHLSLSKHFFQAFGKVAWVKKTNEHFDIGLEFIDSTPKSRVRMVEQICYIEHYKNEVYKKEGRILTGEQAALEWISKFAKDFPTYN